MPENERERRSPHLNESEWLELLTTGSIDIEGRLPWSSNFSFLVTVSSPGLSSSGDEEVRGRAVYKPGRGERALWDFGPDLYRHEVACYELSTAFALALVPETVVRSDGPLGPGSLQRFIDADFGEHYFTLLDEARHHDDLRRLAAFDVLCNNADRKAGHVLIDSEDHIWGIDNGLSFHEDDKLRTVIWDFADEQVPEDVLGACRAIVEKGIPSRVAELLGHDEVAALGRRARRMCSQRRLPAPRDDYRAYPWPLV